MMKKLNEVTSVTVPVAHYQHDNVITEEAVVFTITREDNHFKAVPLLLKEELLITKLPEKLEFVYFDYCIVTENSMDEETLNVIKRIILELEAQDYFG
jgi:hypothetical protein